LKQVNYTVPFPTKCPECEYDGFTEVQPRHNFCSFLLSIPLFLTFSTCMLFGCCEGTRTHCLDECKDVDHACYNCKTTIAEKKSVIRRGPISCRNQPLQKFQFAEMDSCNETDESKYESE